MNKLFSNNNIKYILFDFETESLSLLKSRPWEIAWIVVENGKIVEEYQKFPFIHDLRVSKDAARVTGFDYKTYKSKSEPAIDVYNLFSKYLYDEDYYLVGQNILFFDAYQWKNFQEYCGKKVDYSFINRIIDTKCLGKAFQLNIEFPKNQKEITPWMYKMGAIKKKGLRASNEFLAKLFDIPYIDAHIGINDAKISNEIFKKLAYKLHIFGY